VFWYIAIIFTVTSSGLEYSMALILNLRVFGIQELWATFRGEPVINPVTVEALFRCFITSIISTSVQKTRAGGDIVVEGWTIIAILATRIVLLLDPMLRSSAGCSMELGPPTTNFPYGTWKNCRDWETAYLATWWYFCAPFILFLFAAFFFQFLHSMLRNIRHYLPLQDPYRSCHGSR